MFKKILPVGIGIVLILLIAFSVSLVKKSTSRTPGIENADTTYVEYGDLKITKDQLYTYMKNKYGTNELLDWADKQLYPEYENVDVNSEEFVKYVNNTVFGVEDLSDPTESEKEAYQETWDDIVSSLKLTGLLSKADASDDSYDSTSSKAWELVKNEYRLSYVRENAAKESYWKKFLEERGNTEEEPFKNFILNTSSATNSVEHYYEENYSDTLVAFFVPFTSKNAALQTMESVGINRDSKVLGANNDWIHADYDYYSKLTIEDSDKYDYNQAFELMVQMFNMVYAYQGVSINLASDCEKRVMPVQTAYSVKNTINDVLTENKTKFGIQVTLPETINVTGADAATITWSVKDTKYAEIESNVLKGNFENGDKEDDTVTVDVTLQYEVKYADQTLNGSTAITLTAKPIDGDPVTYESLTDAVTAFPTTEVAQVEKYYFTEDFLAKEFDNVKFTWTDKEAKDFSSDLATYISSSSSALAINDDPAKLYGTYTTEPVAIGDYYGLVILVEVKPVPELFDGETNTLKDSDGNITNETYTIKNQELFDEICAAMKAEILDDVNNIDQMIYENRYNHGLTIYDAYMEAIYEYQYNYFFETTIAANDFDEFKKSKKKEKVLVASIQKEAGNKKDVITLSAEDLFKQMEVKYASTAIASYINNYNLITNTKYNNIYNSYTDEVLNEKLYKNLLNGEVSTLRKNFEADYFTYSYLSYYGFTPNFPAKYGWKKFIKDYFMAESDQELLTNAIYGGTIYSEAIKSQLADLTIDKIEEEMQKAQDEYWDLTVCNLLIMLDFDYNADSDGENNSANMAKERVNWEGELEDDAKELAKLMYELAPQTGENSFEAQMSALVTLFKDATFGTETLNDIKQAAQDNKSIYEYNYFGYFKRSGLTVKFEAANKYTNADSLAKEFAEECKTLFATLKAEDKLDKTFDTPYIDPETVITDFGMHKIAVVSTGSLSDLPSLDNIKVYRANKNITDTQETIDSTKSTIEEYTTSGYDTTSYKANLEFAEAKMETYKAEKAALYKELGLAEDYELSDEETKLIDAWYTNAQSELENGTLLTEVNTADLLANISKVNFVNGANTSIDTFKAYLELVQEECAKENE